MSFGNHAHATATEFLDDAVVRNYLADVWRGGLTENLRFVAQTKSINGTGFEEISR